MYMGCLNNFRTTLVHIPDLSEESYWISKGQNLQEANKIGLYEITPDSNSNS